MTTPRQIQRAYREAAKAFLRRRLEPFPVELVGWDEASTDAFADAVVDAYKVALVDPDMAILRGEGSATNSATIKGA